MTRPAAPPRADAPHRDIVASGGVVTLTFSGSWRMDQTLPDIEAVRQALAASPAPQKLVLAGEDVARAAVAGFATALGERPDTRDSAPDLLAFLASFSPEELAGAGRQLAAPCPPDEEALFEAAWPGHAAAVAEALAAVTAG